MKSSDLTVEQMTAMLQTALATAADAAAATADAVAAAAVAEKEAAELRQVHEELRVSHGNEERRGSLADRLGPSRGSLERFSPIPKPGWEMGETTGTGAAQVVSEEPAQMTADNVQTDLFVPPADDAEQPQTMQGGGSAPAESAPLS